MNAEYKVGLKTALREAEPAVLLMVYAQLTGDHEFLDQFRAHIRKVREFATVIPEPLLAELHGRLEKLLEDPSIVPAARPLDLAVLRKMMDICVGEPVPDEYVPMLLEDLGINRTDVVQQYRDEAPKGRFPSDFRVAIIGAGLSGICAAIYLRLAGVEFDLFDKNDGVGGTWYENRYPGCGVDAANHWYSYSFEMKHDWSRYFVKQPELQAYFEHCVSKYDIRRSMHLRTEVVSAEFDEARDIWRVTVRTADEAERVLEVNAVICAVGQLNNPKIPRIPGLEDFKGPAFHTARWDENVDIKNKRVALVGTGASGIQVGPTIAEDVAELKIYQRSPQWVNKRANYHRSVTPGKMWALKNIPYYAQWYRFQLFWAYSDALYPALKRDPSWNDPGAISAVNDDIRKQWLAFLEERLADRPDLLSRSIPDYPPFGKRPLFDNNWFETLKRDNVSLVQEGIRSVQPDGIETDDGAFHPTDVIVLATGFHASKMIFPLEVRGRDGHTIRKDWGDEDPRAYLGITVPNYPNFFILYGPNTNYAHGGSIAFNAECQSRYILQCLHLLKERGAAAMEVRPEVFQDYNAKVDETHRDLVWSHEGVNTWYKNSAGRVTTNSPFRLLEYWQLTHAPSETDFIFVGETAGSKATVA